MMNFIKLLRKCNTKYSIMPMRLGSYKTQRTKHKRPLMALSSSRSIIILKANYLSLMSTLSLVAMLTKPSPFTPKVSLIYCTFLPYQSLTPFPLSVYIENKSSETFDSSDEEGPEGFLEKNLSDFFDI